MLGVGCRVIVGEAEDGDGFVVGEAGLIINMLRTALERGSAARAQAVEQSLVIPKLSLPTITLTGFFSSRPKTRHRTDFALNSGNFSRKRDENLCKVV